MSAENAALDPYEAVLADLRAKRDQIDQAIQVIQALRGVTAGSSPMVQKAVAQAAPSDGPGAFLGMTIPDAAKKLLASRRKTLSNHEILAAFNAGGLVMNSADPINTVGSVLTRRFKQVGDIVRVGRGVWGLAEWYPNRSFKKKEPSKNGAEPQSAPPSEPPEEEDLLGVDLSFDDEELGLNQ